MPTLSHFISTSLTYFFSPLRSYWHQLCHIDSVSYHYLHSYLHMFQEKKARKSRDWLLGGKVPNSLTHLLLFLFFFKCAQVLTRLHAHAHTARFTYTYTSTHERAHTRTRTHARAQPHSHAYTRTHAHFFTSTLTFTQTRQRTHIEYNVTLVVVSLRKLPLYFVQVYAIIHPRVGFIVLGTVMSLLSAGASLYQPIFLGQLIERLPVCEYVCGFVFACAIFYVYVGVCFCVHMYICLCVYVSESVN